ncbi:MAG: hypothetical protein ACUVTX_02430 [Bacteroidales bacterium]
MPYSESYKRILYKLGYYSYQERLIYRYLRQRGNWDAHLTNCRRFLLRAVEIMKPGKITVLGSGWILDFPLAELLEKSVKITLIDIVHPPDVKKQLAGNERVKIIEEDITGGLIEEVWNKAGRLPFYRKMNSLSCITVKEYRLKDEDPGMVVSLNILSQLDVLPVRLLRRKAVVKEEDIERLRYEIQKKHLDFLLRFNSVLITDTKEIFTNRHGVVTEELTIVVPLPQSAITEEWTWDFDLAHSDYYGKQSVLKVVGMILQ